MLALRSAAPEGTPAAVLVRLVAFTALVAGCTLASDLDGLASPIAGDDGGGGSAHGAEGGAAGGEAGTSASGASGASGVSGSDAGDGGLGCPPGRKACVGDCVPLDDPNTGCGASDCSACGLANASAICVAGACAVEQCAAGFEDCNDTPADGCEADLDRDVTTCGSCQTICSLPNSVVSCASGQCRFEACNPGFFNCDADTMTGCETNIAADPSNCGGCAIACTAPPGKSAVCTDRICGISDCAEPLADCDGDPSGSCETDKSTSLDHCGFCSNACSYAHAGAACISGACSLGTCQSGWGNCDGVTATGCETSTASSISHCGGCGNACPSGPRGAAACASGTCELDCDSGWGDCNSGATDGCETALTTNANCRACGNAIGASGTAAANAPYALRRMTAAGSTLTLEYCYYDSCSGETCTQGTITLAGATASGTAGANAPYALRRMTAAGNTLTLDFCYYDSCSGETCTQGTITLAGATASGTAGANAPYALRRMTAAGNTLTLDFCYYDSCSGETCTQGTITLACAP